MLYGWRLAMACSGLSAMNAAPAGANASIDRAQIGEIAAAPVARGAQSVEAHRDARRASVQRPRAASGRR